MGVSDRETGQGKYDFSHGRIKQILGPSTKNAGMAKTQFKFLKKAGCVDTRVYARGGESPGESKKERKSRKDTTEQIGQNVMPDNVEQRKKWGAKEKRRRTNSWKHGVKIRKRGKSPKKVRRRDDGEKRKQRHTTRKEHKKNRVRKTAADKRKRTGKR